MPKPQRIDGKLKRHATNGKLIRGETCCCTPTDRCPFCTSFPTTYTLNISAIEICDGCYVDSGGKPISIDAASLVPTAVCVSNPGPQGCTWTCTDDSNARVIAFAHTVLTDCDDENTTPGTLFYVLSKSEVLVDDPNIPYDVGDVVAMLDIYIHITGTFANLHLFHGEGLITGGDCWPASFTNQLTECADPGINLGHPDNLHPPPTGYTTDTWAYVAIGINGTVTVDESPCVPCDADCYEITANYDTGDVEYFNGGADFAAGDYQIEYLSGAITYDFDDQDFRVNAVVDQYYYEVVSDMDSYGEAPPVGEYTEEVSQAAVEAANAGATMTFTHTGGPIGIKLNDSPYDDNALDTGDPDPHAPRFRLCPVTTP